MTDAGILHQPHQVAGVPKPSGKPTRVTWVDCPVPRPSRKQRGRFAANDVANRLRRRPWLCLGPCFNILEIRYDVAEPPIVGFELLLLGSNRDQIAWDNVDSAREDGAARRLDANQQPAA
jgi:hypothetical protein